MEFHFLGTGTSAGVPSIGCDCAVCTSADPRDQRLRTSAAIVYRDPTAKHEGQRRTVLIDAGPDLRQQALRAKLTRCDAIFFTHNHVDHTFGLDEIRRFNVVQRAPVELYAEEHTPSSSSTASTSMSSTPPRTSTTALSRRSSPTASQRRWPRSICMACAGRPSACCTASCRWSGIASSPRRDRRSVRRGCRWRTAPTCPRCRLKVGRCSKG